MTPTRIAGSDPEVLAARAAAEAIDASRPHERWAAMDHARALYERKRNEVIAAQLKLRKDAAEAAAVDYSAACVTTTAVTTAAIDLARRTGYAARVTTPGLMAHLNGIAPAHARALQMAMDAEDAALVRQEEARHEYAARAMDPAYFPR